MKLLMTADAMGGVWTYAMELIAALEPYGAEILLATMGRRPSADQQREAARLNNISLHISDHKLEWMEHPWSEVDAAGEWLLELERSFAPDVVHLNGYAHGSLPWRAGVLIVGHSCVMSWWRAVHGKPAPPTWARYCERVAAGLHAADIIVAPTAAMAEHLRREYGPLPRIEVIANGRTSALFTAGPKHPFILAAGRMWDEAKNLSSLDIAAAGLPWRVYVAGPVDHPDIDWTCEPAHLRLLGSLPGEAMRQWLRCADIYALPARYEPFGLSILEAALSGCALVIGDCDSLRELWHDAAVFVPPDDPEAIHHSLRRLIKQPARRRRLAAAAHRRAMEFSPQRMAEAYLEFYRALARRHLEPELARDSKSHATGSLPASAPRRALAIAAPRPLATVHSMPPRPHRNGYLHPSASLEVPRCAL